MEMTTFEALKLAAVGITHLFSDALHIHVGLLVLFAAAMVTRKPLGSLVPWSVVLGVLAFGEVMNMQQDLRNLGHWRWQQSLHGLVNALVWPTVLLFVARSRSSLLPRG
jgi:hypothetical protein